MRHFDLGMCTLLVNSNVNIMRLLVCHAACEDFSARTEKHCLYSRKRVLFCNLIVIDV